MVSQVNYSFQYAAHIAVLACASVAISATPCIAQHSKKMIVDIIRDCDNECRESLQLSLKAPSSDYAQSWSVESLLSGAKTLDVTKGKVFCLKSKSFDKLCSLEPSLLPVFIDLLDQEELISGYAAYAIPRISMVRPNDSELSIKDSATPKYWKEWWASRYDLDSRFAKLHQEFTKSQIADKGVISQSRTVLDLATGKSNDVTEKTRFGKAVDQLRDIGRDAIPFIVEQFEAGDYSLRFLFEELTDRKNAPNSHFPTADVSKAHIKWWRDPSENAQAMRYQMPPLDAGKKK